jgi:antitoxin component of MazEF toxin-antitoxin module
MIKRITKVGNGHALFLDKPILELLGLAAGAEVELVVQDGVLIVAPVKPRTIDRRRFEAALNRVMSERRDALRRLAE